MLRMDPAVELADRLIAAFRADAAQAERKADEWDAHGQRTLAHMHMSRASAFTDAAIQVTVELRKQQLGFPAPTPVHTD